MILIFPMPGESGFCYVHQVSGTLLQEYRHPGPVYGCDWRDADILASGCEDGKIRIFDVTKNRKEPVTELKGWFKFCIFFSYLQLSFSIYRCVADRSVWYCIVTYKDAADLI